jgi:hypothetical protein
VAAALAPSSSPGDGPPWPLTRDELDLFAVDGVEASAVEELSGQDGPSVLRWRAVFRRPR